MKKSKKFGKAQVALAVMVVALAAAVGLNMKYSSEQAGTQDGTSSKYMGEAEYVNASVSDESYDKDSENDYFTQMRKQRQTAREEALDILEETLDRTNLTDEDKAEALEKKNAIAAATEQEAAIETVLKAKGFKNVVAVIGEIDINIIVDVQPTSAQTSQIQDAVLSHTSFEISDIKIITAEQN